MDIPFALIVASMPIVTTDPVPVGFSFKVSTPILELYSEVLTLYSATQYSAILVVSTVNTCFLYPSV